MVGEIVRRIVGPGKGAVEEEPGRQEGGHRHRDDPGMACRVPFRVRYRVDPHCDDGQGHWDHHDHVPDVITSYSIHYTKLYDYAFFS